MLTPPAPTGAKLIKGPYEGGYWPSPVRAQSNWTKMLAKLTPQGGLK
jgi:hypothetical protein